MANDSKADGGEGQTQRPDTSKELETSSNLLSEANLLTPTETGDEKEITDVTGSNPVTVQSTMEVVADETTETLAETNVTPSEDPANSGEKVEFKVIYNKKKYDVNFPLDSDVGALKSHLQSLIGIPPAMMKVMIKGLAKDEMTLRKLGVTKGSKVMVVGSSLNDVLKVSTKDAAAGAAGSSTSTDDADKDEKVTTCKLKQHKKVLDQGKPDDAMVGLKGIKQPLPPTPLTGMLNKNGGKVRLTFKLELDQLWIGTKERTEKVFLNTIKNVVSEPIENHEEYHILALQLGPTEASRYWIYWVPAQYVEAIKDSVLGKWQFY